MSTVEKVSRAIARARGMDPDATSVTAFEGAPRACRVWESLIPSARAALTALREPSEGMVEAGDEAMRKDGLDWSLEPGEGLDGVDSRPSWRAMINQALSEGEG
jgi:hypothetical protein